MTTTSTKNAWKSTAWFIILLVIAIPFYSANALAVSVQVTKNSGAQQIPGYLDATGDTWTVEATITGSPEETIDPANVKLKIGTNEAQFQSCSDGVLGVVCQYLSPLSSGVREAEYAFQVLYNYLALNGVPGQASGSDVIRADGTGPKVEITTLRENTKGQTEIDFSVSDKVAGAPAIGIKTIEIVDAATGTVVQTISFPRQGVTDYLYSRDSGFGNILQASLTGEGQKRIKVRAEDWLGHTTASVPVRSFASDFVTPIIHDNLEFVNLGKFIGSAVVATDITVDVTDTNLETVKGYSEQAELDGNEAACTPDQEHDGVWHCVWKDIEVSPVSSVSVTIAAKDSYGNSAERTIAKNFIPDNSPPQITFFGTQRTLEGKSYIKSGSQHIILSVTEQGAGIDADGILGDLSALGKSAYEKPTCTSENGMLNCYWDTFKEFSGAGVARIRLSKFQDKVGNEGQRQELELFIDTEGPKVESLEAYGVSAIGEKDYFQSNDQMKLKMTIAEATAPIILVNVNGMVMDAATQFPETADTKGLSPSTGWQVFTADNCERQEAGDWVCVIDTAPLKSGPDSDAHIELKVQDTAGNDAAAWPAQARNVNLRPAAGKATISFKLLGLDIEEHPEHWEVASGFPKPVVAGGFVDLDTVTLGYTRIPLALKMHSSNAHAKVLSMEMASIDGCTAISENAPELSRVVLAGGNFPDGTTSPSATLLLEFQPFDGRQQFGLGEEDFETVAVTYTCSLRIFSRIDQNALSSAEIQDVIVLVPFGFSTLGSLDENVANKIRDIRESGFMKFADALAYLDAAFKWLNYIGNMVQIIVNINQFVDLFTEAQRDIADGVEKTPAAPVATALRGGCFAAQQGTGATWEFLQPLQSVALILSCNPQPAGEFTEDITLSWYGKWQRTVLDAYNIASGRGALGVPAQSLYDNMYTSSLGLCLPGIVFNINKAREIQCRKIICYGREVPAGIATMDACDKLYDLQMCEFVYGPLLDFTPLGGVGYLGSMLKSSLTSPLGLISLTEVVGCAGLCWTPLSPGWLTACKVTTGINKALTIIDSIIGIVNNRPDVQGSPYCDLADNIKLDELVGSNSRTSSTETTSASSPSTVS